MNLNYCVVCPGELSDETILAEYGSVSTGKYYCSECGLKYEFVPPFHLQKRPQQPLQVEITWKGDGI